MMVCFSKIYQFNLSTQISNINISWEISVSKISSGSKFKLKAGGGGVVREHHIKKMLDPILSKVVIVIGFNLGA